ncbi:hypothetical protein [Streptomyces sp. NPDC051684]
MGSGLPLVGVSVIVYAVVGIAVLVRTGVRRLGRGRRHGHA